MKGPEHYRAAADLLGMVTDAETDMVIEAGGRDWVANTIAAAAVHAELARIAAFGDAS